MSADELKAIRLALGLSVAEFAAVVRVHGDRTVRKWEAGERGIPGPVAVIAEVLRDSADFRARLGIGGLL